MNTGERNQRRKHATTIYYLVASSYGILPLPKQRYGHHSLTAVLLYAGTGIDRIHRYTSSSS